MKIRFSRNLLIGLTMLAGAGLALALTPRQKSADHVPNVNLETIIPKQFGEWKLDEAIAPTIYSPVTQAALDKLYDQLLDRSYVNDKGERIMLVVTYGSNQSYSMQVHRPEVCYPSQGFQVGDVSKAFIDAGGNRLPVMRLVASKGPRIEPVTYWVMIGDSAVRGNFEQHLARVKYGLTGEVPHGMLIRVSTLSANATQSYRTEERFVQAMIAAMPAEFRKTLAGQGQ